jgi:Sulfotransferase family
MPCCSVTDACIVTRVAAEEASAARPTAGPLVIGGLGGSGTRLVAEIAEGMGFYLGADRNAAGDNLWFTLLLKRPRWYRRVRQRGDDAAVRRNLGILEKALTTGRLTPWDWAFVLRATADIGLRGHDHKRSGRGRWALARAASLYGRPKPRRHPRAWGWKEPNSHVFLPELARHFPGLRYVHTIRHGLDMAHSPKRAQLYNWGWLYGVDPPGDPDQVPRAQLRFWVETTRRADEIGRELLGDRFLLLNFDRLCREPEAGIDLLTRFAGVTLTAEERARLAELPRVPESAGRFAEHDLDGFAPRDLASLGEFGFEVPASPAL